jgi:serine/threonine protein phosphatase PrpC
VANAGDSRCIIGVNGTSVAMSVDHKPDLPSERDRIYKAGKTVVNGRVDGNLSLSRAIGDLEYKMNSKLAPDQ